MVIKTYQMSDLSKLQVFRKRMKKLNIEIEMWSNYPWIYIDKVNGNKVRQEDYFHGDHGFTIGFHPIRPDQVFEFTDIGEIFKLIRKYK
jgi:hypothetical protein